MDDNFFKETEDLINAVLEGQFDVRGDADAFSGKNRDLVSGINSIIDIFAETLNMVSANIERIAGGDIPDLITDEFKGGFNTIKESQNRLIQSMNEIAVTAVLISSGTMDGVEIAERSDRDRIVKAFNLLVKRLKGFLLEIDGMIHGVREGNLKVRGDTEQFTGSWKELVANTNTLMAALMMNYQRALQSEKKYRSLFDSAPDGILISGFDGKIIAFNDTAMKLFKYDDHEEFSRTNTRDCYQNPDKDRLNYIENLKAAGRLENYLVDFKDRLGRPFTASLSCRIIRYAEEKSIQTILRDITEIKKMESELRHYAENQEKMLAEKTRELKSTIKELSAAIDDLRETRERMAQKSFQAGMAEMAVSVLHNIGNAITPVNIRVGGMAESGLIAPEVFQSLKTVHAILSEEKAGPDGQAGKLAKLVSTITGVLHETDSNFREDLNFIEKNIEHIKENILLQQRYAGVVGVEKQVNPNSLLTDAADMLKDSIEKRGIDLQFDLQNIPDISLDKNKMMQIFVNILKNAYEAIDMSPNTHEKTIRVTTSIQTEASRKFFRMAVLDAGVGVSPEIKHELFKFSFSTKKRGTGFGLHDAANYIKARKGTISLSSEGLGKGARIVVTLPLNQHNENGIKTRGDIE